MKTIYSAILFTLLFSGCSQQNAFTKFNMNQQQELSESSLQSSKVILNEEVHGVFSSIYLNEVYPKSFNQYEYFYVYIYLKEESDLHNPNTLDDIELTLKLNGKTPVKIQELDSDNRFSHLSEVRSDWNKYYLVAFEPVEEESLKLVLHNMGATSAALVYEKQLL